MPVPTEASAFAWVDRFRVHTCDFNDVHQHRVTTLKVKPVLKKMRKDRSFAIENHSFWSGSCPHVLSTEAVQIPEAWEKHSWVAYVKRTGWNEKSFGTMDSWFKNEMARHWISHTNSVGNGDFPRKKNTSMSGSLMTSSVLCCLQVPVSTEDLFATRPRTKKACLILRFESAEIGIWHSNWRQILGNLASLSKCDLGRQDWMKKARTSKTSKGHGRSWRWKTMNTSKLWKILGTFNSSLGAPGKTKPRAKATVSIGSIFWEWIFPIFSHFFSPLGWTWVPLDLSLSSMAFLPNFQDPFYLPICRFLRCRWMSYTQLIQPSNSRLDVSLQKVDCRR